MGDGLLEEAHAVGVAEVVGMLRVGPVSVEVADAHADELEVEAGGVHVADVLGEDLGHRVVAVGPRGHVGGALDGARVVRLGQHPGAAGVGDAFGAVVTGGLEHVVGADHVLQGVLPLPPGHVDQVNDRLHAGGGVPHLLRVDDVPDDEVLDTGGRLAVEAAHLVTFLQALDEGRSDGSGRAGDQYSHASPLFLLSVSRRAARAGGPRWPPAATPGTGSSWPPRSPGARAGSTGGAAPPPTAAARRCPGRAVGGG